MKTIRIILTAFFIITSAPFIPLQAALIYDAPVEQSRAEKKSKFRRLKKNKRKRLLKKRLSLRQNNRSPEAKKALTYFILTGSAIAIAVALFVISLPFWFASPASIGILLVLFSIAFLIAAIVFLVNGIMYLNKAAAQKKAAKN